jgi:hypothetical protein
MGSTIASLALALSIASTGGLGRHGKTGGHVLPPGPGAGWGFPNGQPDGYGYVDYGVYLPLGADRTPDYYFPRNFALPPIQAFPQTYYNPYVSNGQRYVGYTACGGDHPAGRAPTGSAELPTNPNGAGLNNQLTVPLPRFTGRVEGTPIPSGGTGLIP